jgi:hypothetical protein
VNVTFLLAVLWEGGRYQGFVGEGMTEGLASDDAYRQVLREASYYGRRFKMLSRSEVAVLPEKDRDSVKADWAPTPVTMYP